MVEKNRKIKEKIIKNRTLCKGNNYVIVKTMVHFRPYLVALRLRKPEDKCTTAAGALFSLHARDNTTDFKGLNKRLTGGICFLRAKF